MFFTTWWLLNWTKRGQELAVRIGEALIGVVSVVDTTKENQ